MPRACPVVHARCYVASNVKLHGASPWHLAFGFDPFVSGERELHGTSPWHLFPGLFVLRCAGPRLPYKAIERDILGGTPLFVGTRVPLQNLIDCLDGGEAVEDFLEAYPTVKREQVIAAINA